MTARSRLSERRTARLHFAPASTEHSRNGHKPGSLGGRSQEGVIVDVAQPDERAITQPNPQQAHRGIQDGDTGCGVLEPTPFNGCLDMVARIQRRRSMKPAVRGGAPVENITTGGSIGETLRFKESHVAPGTLLPPDSWTLTIIRKPSDACSAPEHWRVAEQAQPGFRLGSLWHEVVSPIQSTPARRCRDVGEAEIPSCEAVGEAGVVETEQVQDGGVEVVDVDFVFHGLKAEFVGGAVNGASFTAPPASHIVKPWWLWSRPLILPRWLPPGVARRWGYGRIRHPRR